MLYKGRVLSKVLVLVLCLAMCLQFTACFGADGTASSKDDLKVGVLLDVNGKKLEQGKYNKIATEIATEDINHYLQELGHTKRVKLFIEDTQGDPSIASEKIKNFKREGIVTVVVQSSAEIQAVLDYAKQNKIILISGSSTAPSLAKPDNNLFRFSMNDTKQAKAIIRYAKETNISNIVLAYRDDIYGNDLKTNIIKFGKESKINIEQEVKYSPTETSFANVVKSIEQNVKQQKSKTSASTTAVVLVSFNEANDICKAASGNAALESVRWIGSDGVPAEASLFKDKESLAFAQKVNFEVCNPGIDASAISSDFARIPDRIKQLAGTDQTPTAALNYYDAMWVLAQSWLILPETSFDLLKHVIPNIARSAKFSTNQIGLDENGDRMWGQYDFLGMKNGKFIKLAMLQFGDWTTEGQFTRISQ